MMHEVWMREALKLAREAQMAGEVPVGAVVVCKEKIIACARNERETSGDPTAHAEVLALRRAAEALGTRRLEGCTLYVTLEPCPMCAAVISAARIARLYYGASDPKSGGVAVGARVFSHPQCHHVPEVYDGIAAAEAERLLRVFFSERR